MNKKGLEWYFIVLIILAAILLLWGVGYYIGIGATIRNLISGFFNSI